MRIAAFVLPAAVSVALMPSVRAGEKHAVIVLGGPLQAASSAPHRRSPPNFAAESGHLWRYTAFERLSGFANRARYMSIV